MHKLHKSLQCCPLRSEAQLCLVFFRYVLFSNSPLPRGAGFSPRELAFVRHALKLLRLVVPAGDFVTLNFEPRTP